MILKERQLYKEFIPVLINLNNTFGIRDMRKAGDEVLELYLSQIFDFTMASYR